MMKRRNSVRWMWMPVVATGMILNSCETVSTLDPCHIGMMETTILSGTSFDFSFGYFGDEEGVMITSYPGHAKSCELLNEQWEERILRYVPEKDFFGSDTVVVTTIKNWDGTVSLEDTVHLTMVIHVVRYEFHLKLMGKWDWIGSCGGFAGDTLLIQGGDFVEEYVKEELH